MYYTENGKDIQNIRTINYTIIVETVVALVKIEFIPLNPHRSGSPSVCNTPYLYIRFEHESKMLNPLSFYDDVYIHG